MTSLSHRFFKLPLVAATIGAACVALMTPAHAADKASFRMVRSPALNTSPSCVPYANAKVRIVSSGEVETMTVDVDGLPPNTGFDLFVLQQPNAPFGMAWYQSDLETDQ